MARLDEAYVEQVLSAVERIPAGQVATYGDLARLTGGGPRLVGAVLARYGAAVSWWRVIRADGRPASGHENEALRLLRADGTPLLGERVHLGRARWAGPIRAGATVDEGDPTAGARGP